VSDGSLPQILWISGFWMHPYRVQNHIAKFITLK
jgi:hypothetical protein